jgi:hypothetical protein
VAGLARRGAITFHEFGALAVSICPKARDNHAVT